MSAITQLRDAVGSGARANKYRVNMAPPSAVPTVSDFGKADILCKSSTFPAVTLGVIEVYNQGRKLVIPGDTTYTNTWTLTFYQTEAHDLRRDMISWLRSADDFQTNKHTGTPGSVMTDMSIEQLDSAGEGTAKYTFHNVFVSEVGEITVADDTQDTIQEFDVTFSFTDWVVGDELENKPAVAGSPTLNEIA